MTPPDRSTRNDQAIKAAREAKAARIAKSARAIRDARRARLGISLQAAGAAEKQETPEPPKQNYTRDMDVFSSSILIWEMGQAGGRTRPMDRDKAFQNAWDVSAVFTELGIKHCLSHGTALGVRRDGDSIPWDDDIDFAIFSEDRPKHEAARRRLRELGFFVPAEGDPTKPIEGLGPLPNMPFWDLVAIRGGEKVECWIFDLVGDYYIYDPERSGLAIKRQFFEGLALIPWRDRLFPAPADMDEFLNLMYGPEWRTPDRKKKYNELRAE